MNCPHCHAKNAFRPVYGSSGSSMHYDEQTATETAISGAVCYNCGHWIEAPSPVVEMQYDFSKDKPKPAKTVRRDGLQSFRDAVKLRLPKISHMRSIGYTWNSLSKWMREDGFTISDDALRRHYNKLQNAA